MENRDPLWDRRDFLKVGAAAAAIPRLTSLLQPAAVRPLPAVPTVQDLAAGTVTHSFRDLFSVPTTRNDLGYVQVAKSVTAITALAFPPYVCCGVPATPWSPGYLRTCEVFLDGQILLSYPGGDIVAYTWFPHRILRETRFRGLHFQSATFMPDGQRAAGIRLSVRNTSSSSRKLTLGFDMRAAVVKKTDTWFAELPGEADNLVQPDASRGCLIFQAQHSQAVSVQGFSKHPSRIEAERMLVFEFDLAPGARQEFQYVNSVADSKDAALQLFDSIQNNFAESLQANERSNNRVLESAFTPGNSEFSGYLPRLETHSEELWNLYHLGVRNLLFARRISPDSVYGRTYLTLGGRVLPTLSFPWDTGLASLSLSLLDPAALRNLTEVWMKLGMQDHLATDYITGQAIGPWYGVNDSAIFRCAQNYLRVTGDFAWLDQKIGQQSVMDHLVGLATNWKKLDKHSHGFGDYGNIENILEVVSTYLHEVPSFNAGNVSMMRFTADLLERRGDKDKANSLGGDAAALAGRINEKLYVAGKGWWKCGQPDGSLVEVRHCLDFIYVLDNMSGDLSAQQKREMAAFFWSELHSELWMRALSPLDEDATWNIRPDHSWMGAYAAWPSATAKGLYRIDSPSRVSAWVKNLSRVKNQGPVGQAHFVESIWPAENGAAMKCPNDQPYINDWCCIAAGNFTDMVIDTIFGADLTVNDGIHVKSLLADFDADAKLVNLRHQGKNYRVSASGAKLVEGSAVTKS
jgi:hypothetical protein